MPASDLKCFDFAERAAKYFEDNQLCTKKNIGGYELVFLTAGKPNYPSERGIKCIQITEDTPSFNDNYLCWGKPKVKVTVEWGKPLQCEGGCDGNTITMKKRVFLEETFSRTDETKKAVSAEVSASYGAASATVWAEYSNVVTTVATSTSQQEDNKEVTFTCGKGKDIYVMLVTTEVSCLFDSKKCGRYVVQGNPVYTPTSPHPRNNVAAQIAWYNSSRHNKE